MPVGNRRIAPPKEDSIAFCPDRFRKHYRGGTKTFFEPRPPGRVAERTNRSGVPSKGSKKIGKEILGEV